MTIPWSMATSMTFMGVQCASSPYEGCNKGKRDITLLLLPGYLLQSMQKASCFSPINYHVKFAHNEYEFVYFTCLYHVV